MDNPRSTHQPVLQGVLISVKELMESLVALDAERDEEGRFKVFATHADALPPQFFLGIDAPDNDILVTADNYVLVQGERKSLVEVAGRHGRGSTVPVIY